MVVYLVNTASGAGATKKLKQDFGKIELGQIHARQIMLSKLDLSESCEASGCRR